MGTKTLLAHGTLSWSGTERRSDRYGEIFLDAVTYALPGADPTVTATPTYNKFVANRMLNKRVRLTAKVIESRVSGHIGDLFLGIKPSQPEVGEEIDLGVGTFEQGSVEWTTAPTIRLLPGDGREVFWFDPHKLYRLHDQTIDLFIEETTDDFSPRPNVGHHNEPEGFVSAGEGYIQAKKAELPAKLPPAFERIGHGLFVMIPPGHGPVGSPINDKDEN
jgi:hypothetical protein